MTTPKSLIINIMSVNVTIVVTICNQQPEQQVFKIKELVKAKEVEDWQFKKRLQYSFITSYKIVGLINYLLSST